MHCTAAMAHAERLRSHTQLTHNRTSRQTYQRDLAVNLSCISALAIWILQGGQLQQTHAVGVNIHPGVILLIIQVRSLELRCA